MAVADRALSVIGLGRIISVLGGVCIALAVLIAADHVIENASFAEIVGRFALVAIPGTVLLYGGYRVPDMDLHPDVRPRVLAWTFGGLGVMVAIVVVIDLISPSGVDDPLSSVSLMIAVGSLAGFGAGIYDGQAKTHKRELEETVEQLRASNQRLEQFAYAASHDLQEPLRMVSSYLQLIERRSDDELTDETREFLEFAVDGADRMRRMIESLLEYSQVTRGDTLEPTDANAVLDDALDDLQLRIEETGASIAVDELPTVTADPDQLAQVFRNLLSNALAYSGDEPPEITVSAERTNGTWRFSVADEGIGIDPEYHDRIFNVFERVHVDKESSESGAGGLGLALCERIIERHGGKVWVESEPGEGSTFYFTLPTPEAPQVTSTTPRNADRATQRP